MQCNDNVLVYKVHSRCIDQSNAISTNQVKQKQINSDISAEQSDELCDSTSERLAHFTTHQSLSIIYVCQN